MKKKIAVFTSLIGLVYVIICSYAGGAAQNCTGANGSQTNCSGSTCHGNKTGTDVYISVKDMNGNYAPNYTPGNKYTITIHGSNPLLQSKYGFQFTAVTALTTPQVPAGTYASFPVHVTSNFYSGLLIVEQTESINAPVPGTYETSFQWVAPAAGTGLVGMYLTLLAVNADTWADTPDISGHVSIVLNENINPNAVQAVQNPIHISAYPNPVTNTLYIDMADNTPGDYTITVYDLNGRLMTTEAANINTRLTPYAINTSAWSPGLYRVVIGKEGTYSQTAVVKQGTL